MNSHEPYPYYKRTASALRICVIFSYELMTVRLYHIVFGKWFLIVLRAKFKVIGQAMRNNGKQLLINTCNLNMRIHACIWHCVSS